MTSRELMEHNRENVGLAGLSLALVMNISPEIIIQVIIGISVPLIVLVVGHFIKRELNHRFPTRDKTLLDKTKEDTKLNK